MTTLNLRKSPASPLEILQNQSLTMLVQNEIERMEMITRQCRPAALS